MSSKTQENESWGSRAMKVLVTRLAFEKTQPHLTEMQRLEKELAKQKVGNIWDNKD